VKLSDLIIEKGPFVTGDVMPFPVAPNGHPIIAADEINELRAELIAGRQARGLDGATPTIHTTMAELRSEKFWAERIATVASAHGMETPDAIHNASGSGDPNLHMLKHPDGRVLLIIRTDREGS
jgi:hypothetical protein